MEGGNGAIERIPDAEKMMLQMFEDHGNLLDDDDDDSPSYKYFNALDNSEKIHFFCGYVDRFMSQFENIGTKMANACYYGLKFPLHLIFWEARRGNRTWDETLEFMKSLPHILLSYAASVRDTDSHQSPLQIICSSSQRAPIEVFQKLVSANPQEVAFQPPGKGSSPLHTLARHSYVEAIAVLAEANPAAHMLRDHDWRLPFDAAKNDEVRSLMVKHYFQFGLAGELFKNSSDEILEVYNALSEARITECLHVLIKEAEFRRRSWDDIEEFLDQLPSSVAAYVTMKQDGVYLWTPLHLAASCAPTRVILKLLEVAPKAATVKNAKGQTPLHCALRGSNKESVELIGKTNPVAVSIIDLSGTTPLDFALRVSGKEMVISLIACYPQSLFVSRTKESRCPGTILNMSFRFDSMRSSYIKGSFDRLISNLQKAARSQVLRGGLRDNWIWLCTVSDENITEKLNPASIVRQIFNGLKDDMRALKLLANIEHVSGRPIVETATPKCAEVINSYFRFMRRYQVDTGRVVHASATCVVLRALDFSVRALYLDVVKSLNKSSTKTLPLNDEKFLHFVSALFREYINQDSDASYSSFTIKEAKDMLRKLSRDKFAVEHNKRCNDVFDGADFDEFCRAVFVDKDTGARSVILKFMNNYNHYDSEIGNRLPWAENECAPIDRPFVPIFDHFTDFDNDTKNCRTFLEVHDFEGKENLKRLDSYQYVVVMPEADRTLDSIARHEQPSKNHIIMMLIEIIQCLEQLHEEGIVHGDIKPMNIVRLNGKMKLIDLDAAGAAGKDFACAKFTSGFLPPEAIYRFQNQDEINDYNSYWKDEKDNKTETWKRIKPKMCEGKWFVVKTFRKGDSMEKMNTLPYNRQLLKMTKCLDSWSVGVLFYKLICGTSLPGLKSDQDDNLVDGQSYQNLEKWSKHSVYNVYYDLDEKISDPGPIQAILATILVQVTKDRPKRISMKGIIDNPFNPDIKTTPVTQLYSSVVLVCVQLQLENGKYSNKCEVGTGFVVDDKLGLVATSRHVISKPGKIFVYDSRNITNSLARSAANSQANSEREASGSSQYWAHIDPTPDVYGATHCHEAIIIPHIGTEDHTVLDACILRIFNYENFDPVPKMNLVKRFEPGETVRILGYRQEALRSHVEGCLNYTLDFSKGTYVTRYDLAQEKDRLYKGAEITVDCNSFRGYSGGPAVNKKGEVIGLVRGFYYDDQPEFDYGLCTLVPSCDIKSLVERARELFD